MEDNGREPIEERASAKKDDVRNNVALMLAAETGIDSNLVLATSWDKAALSRQLEQYKDAVAKDNEATRLAVKFAIATAGAGSGATIVVGVLSHPLLAVASFCGAAGSALISSAFVAALKGGHVVKAKKKIATEIKQDIACRVDRSKASASI